MNYIKIALTIALAISYSALAQTPPLKVSARYPLTVGCKSDKDPSVNGVFRAAGIDVANGKITIYKSDGSVQKEIDTSNGRCIVEPNEIIER